MNDQRVRIENQDRIVRILARICQSNLPVILRTKEDRMVAVRGRAVALLQGELRGLRISNISDIGMGHIAESTTIRVEFRGMASQVIFDGNIVARDQNSIVMGLPIVLHSIERRKNARFKTVPAQSAFIDLSFLRKEHLSPDVNISAPHFSEMNSWLRIVDISEGGFATISRFPSIADVLPRGIIDDEAKMRLPMLEPIPVRAEVRWSKRIRERTGDTHIEQYSRRFVAGWEFVSVNDQLLTAIRQYIRAVNFAEAI